MSGALEMQPEPPVLWCQQLKATAVTMLAEVRGRIVKVHIRSAAVAERDLTAVSTKCDYPDSTVVVSIDLWEPPWATSILRGLGSSSRSLA